MIKFSIDYIDNNSFYKNLDYSNKIILNAIADPLFVYDKKTNKYTQPDKYNRFDI